MRCQRCRGEVKLQGTDRTYWCTCGYHWTVPPETAEIDPQGPLFSITVPEPETHEKRQESGKPNRRYDVYVANRKVYLEYHGLNEVDILTDKDGNEYWIEENEETGEFTYKYVPKRYRKGTNGYTTWF